MVVTFIDIWAGSRVPAEMIALRTSWRTGNCCSTVYKGVLINLSSGGIKNKYALGAVDEFIARNSHPFRNFKDKGTVARPGRSGVKGDAATAHILQAVVGENATDIAHIVPKAVSTLEIGHQVVVTYHFVAVVKDLYSSREIAGDVFDVVARENVAFE